MTNKPELKSVFDPDFWRGEDQELLDILEPLLIIMAIKIGTETAADIGIDWESVNERVVGWAEEYLSEEVKLINDSTKKMVQGKVADWIESGDPLRELEKELLPTFGKVRAKRIAVTEVTNAYAGGNLETWKASGLVEKKRWNTAGTDVCPICMGLDQQVVPINAMFIGDDGMQYDRPPAHVNCKCNITPVVELPGKSYKLAMDRLLEK